MKVMKDGEDVIQSYLIINSHDSISANTMKRGNPRGNCAGY